MYALLTCPKPKSKRRRTEGNGGDKNSKLTVNEQYLQAMEQYREKDVKVYPHDHYVLDLAQLEENCFPMHKYAELQRLAKEKKANPEIKKEATDDQEDSDSVSDTNYYSVIGDDDGTMTDAISREAEEEKENKAKNNRSTPYNLVRSSQIDYSAFGPLTTRTEPPLPFRKMLAVDCEMVLYSPLVCNTL